MERQTYHHKNLRPALIEKGIELVNEYGIAQISLRKVAQACGVSHAAPYSHFSSKEELYAAMQTHITERFTEALERTISAYQGQPAFLLEFGKAYVSFFMERPHYFTFLFQQGAFPLDLDLDSPDARNYPPFALYREQVLRLLEGSPLSREQKEDQVIALFAFIHGLTSLATMKNVRYSKAWESKLEDLIRAFPFPYAEGAL